MRTYANDVDYWNEVAKECIDLEKKLLKDNFDKKRTIIKELLNFDLSKEKILEIGCGCGFIGSIMGQLYGHLDYTATDMSPVFCDMAKILQRRRPTEARITALPFPDKTFTVIFIFDVLEHIAPNERINGYQEINRVFKNHGHVFINTPVARGIHHPDYDHGFDHRDLMTLQDILGMEISYLNGYISKEKFSQFLVLAR